MPASSQPGRTAAFLRAINVGGRRVKMDRLRAVFEALPLTGVQTFIASGNVVFDTPTDRRDLRQAIEAHLNESLGYRVDTFLRPVAALEAIAAYDGLVAPEGCTLSVGFLHAPAAPDALATLSCPTDQLRVHGRELYWLRLTSFRESKISGAALERALGGPTTLRNVRTVQRMADRFR